MPQILTVSFVSKKFKFLLFLFCLLALVKDSLETSLFEFTLLFNNTETISLEKYNRIFYEFYDEIKNYFSEYQVNLKETLTKTFQNLFSTMLNIYTNENFDESCIKQNIDKINPFGSDIVKEMENQLKLCLESVKLFNTGLTKARDIILELYSKFENPSEECQRMVTTMTSCSLCNSDEFYVEKVLMKPCYKTCLDVYKKCFSIDSMKFDSSWDTFLGNFLHINPKFEINSLLSKLSLNEETGI